MSYIDRNLLPDERILFRTRKHIIIFLLPFLFLILSVYASIYMQSDPILVRLAWMPWLVVVIWWGAVAIEYITSEFAVTNKRVMMREGFFYRHALEMRIATVSQVTILQSLLGQLLDYGSVTINAFGAYDSFSYIAKPYLFQKYVNGELDKLAR